MEFLCSLVVKIKLQCLIKTYQRHPKIFWKANPSNSYRLSFWNFPSSVFLQPISALHSALPAWRRTRATRSVGTWASPDCSMAVRGIGGCANTFLPLSSGTYDLNKKQAKSHDILRAKCFGRIDWRFLGLQNRLYPEALRLSMVPNINIPLLLVQGAPKRNNFWYPKT